MSTGVRMVEAYMQNGELSWVKFDKVIRAMEDIKIVKDTAKFQKKLQKEKEKDNTIIGIVDAGVCLIKLHENGTFSGIVWAGRTRLSGSYTNM